MHSEFSLKKSRSFRALKYNNGKDKALTFDNFAFFAPQNCFILGSCSIQEAVFYVP